MSRSLPSHSQTGVIEGSKTNNYQLMGAMEYDGRSLGDLWAVERSTNSTVTNPLGYIPRSELVPNSVGISGVLLRVVSVSCYYESSRHYLGSTPKYCSGAREGGRQLKLCNASLGDRLTGITVGVLIDELRRASVLQWT